MCLIDSYENSVIYTTIAIVVQKLLKIIWEGGRNPPPGLNRVKGNFCSFFKIYLSYHLTFVFKVSKYSEYSKIYIKNILGHGPSLHSCVSILELLQSKPPLNGVGLLQCRILCWVLPSQVAEHTDQSDQSEKPPATKRELIYLFIYSCCWGGEGVAKIPTPQGFFQYLEN